ncbi:MAG TPA: hypothetical protein VHC42_02470 [Rhizomicrobium sp.]|nr:hypothetical protein [Rhizomicrobium sp.]
MRRIAALLLLPLLTLSLAGCMLFETQASRNLRKTPTYRQGYEDGCASANAEGADMRHGDIARDDALYDTDKGYHAGWATGHSACGRMAPTGQSEGVLQDRNPGGGR